MPHDFAIATFRCRWQAMPLALPAQGLAAAWLRDVAGDTVADGLHRDARGRPRLASGDVGWSHSHGRLLIAHAGQGRVGVDIEATARRADPLRIARRYFAGEEIDALQALDEDARHRVFLRLWCAKEAVLKAHGQGLSFGLHRLAFALDDGVLRMTGCDPALGDAAAWTLHELQPEPGFIATLAASDEAPPTMAP